MGFRLDKSHHLEEKINEETRVTMVDRDSSRL